MLSSSLITVRVVVVVTIIPIIAVIVIVGIIRIVTRLEVVPGEVVGVVVVNICFVNKYKTISMEIII